MNTKKIQALLKVHELENVSLAAKALGLTQSAVSHIISDTEEELGFGLFIRTRQRTYLTPEGLRVLPHMQAIMREYEAMLEEAQSIRALDEGTVRIGTFSSVAVHWLPGILKAFEKDYPRIQFKLLSGDYYDIERWLTNRDVDVAFTTLPCAANAYAEPLFEDKLMAILPAEHPLAHCDPLPLKLMEDEPFIGIDENSNQDARRALENAGMKLRMKYSTKDDYAVIAMVEQGLGYSIMPELLLKTRSDNVCAIETDPPARRTIALALPAENPDSPAVRRFVEYIRKWVKENA